MVISLGYKDHEGRVYQPKAETAALVIAPQLDLDWQCGGLDMLFSGFIWSLRQLFFPNLSIIALVPGDSTLLKGYGNTTLMIPVIGRRLVRQD